MNIFHAVLLGIVEGLTEFIPVSSTGHLIVAGHLLGFEGKSSATFEIFIQLGAILAVVWVYREKFLGILNFKNEQGFHGLNGAKLLILTTIPALVFGLVLHGFIKRHLFNSLTVAVGLGLGGIAILIAEAILPKLQFKEGLDSLTLKDALIIGFCQCLALWPGISRSGATIIGAMALRIDRKTAAEYSFFAAVPVLCAATAFDLLKNLSSLQSSDIPIFAVGFLVSIVAAWLSIKFFIKIVSSHRLTGFGIYRLIITPFIYFFAK